MLTDIHFQLFPSAFVIPNLLAYGTYREESFQYLYQFIEHRIADQRVVDHIKKWLNAGVLEDGELTRAKEGAIQGGSISPLLSNVYLHYVFDLWVDKWRHQVGRQKVVVVRYADDCVPRTHQRMMLSGKCGAA